MSCQRCDAGEIETFVRVGNGNVKIVGCHEHLQVLLEQNRRGTQRPATRQNLDREATEFLGRVGAMIGNERLLAGDTSVDIDLDKIAGIGTRMLIEQVQIAINSAIKEEQTNA